MSSGWGIIPKKTKQKKKSNSKKRNEINLNFSSDNLTNTYQIDIVDQRSSEEILLEQNNRRD